MMIDILMPVLNDIANIGDMAYQKYRTPITISMKKDQTPLTSVDTMIHYELSKSLNHFFPHIPIISEEGKIPPVNERQLMDEYWLLDPLDGTTGFIEETDEFVISLGLIKHQQPIMGIIHHPISGKSWVSIKGRGVFVQQQGGEILPIQASLNQKDKYTILVSSHHNDENLSKVIARQRQKDLNCPVELKPVGSALKFGYLADGIGDEYLRFTPVNEWDFAAGHSLVIESGFTIFPLDPKESVNYGTETMLIPPVSIRRQV